MADINYLESEQKEAWKRIVELEKKAELFKADIVLYKTPIPSDIKYIKGSRNKISEMKIRVKKYLNKLTRIYKKQKSIREYKKECEEAKQLDTLISLAKEKILYLPNKK